MLGNFLSCSKGVKDPSDFPEVRCDYPRDASAEIDLIYPGGALDLRRGPQGAALVASGKASPNASGSGASLDSFPFDAGAKTCVETGPEPEDSSPVLTWILGYFWGLPRGRKEPSSRATRRKRGSYGYGRDPRASSRGETGMLGNFLSCSKGVKDPSDFPEVRCDYPRDASAEIDLIYPGGALDLRRGPQGAALVASGKASPNASGSGASLDSFPFDAGAKTCVETGPEPEDSSPVLTWILGYFWGLPRGRKEPSSRATRRKRGSYGYGRDPRASSRGETGMLGNFLSCSKGVKDPSDFPEVRCDYPRDASAEIDLIYPGGLSHVRPWWESILLVKVKAVQGKQFPQECSETSGGLLEWWHDAGVALSFPVESPYS
ncbi:hypothetical protein MJG53_014728 [Ovis ammon polii x Ovis aries]|uniref:Uncharacterized protein n=1 Tax=Ovis ammon polii x Ovis aries TaxID=2918886 RepID=A0ACB9UD50_9CETA|nr:hypothetical protein MJG53_014728 [Ovis ammon polii x Ovis aries]